MEFTALNTINMKKVKIKNAYIRALFFLKEVKVFRVGIITAIFISAFIFLLAVHIGSYQVSPYKNEKETSLSLHCAVPADPIMQKLTAIEARLDARDAGLRKFFPSIQAVKYIEDKVPKVFNYRRPFKVWDSTRLTKKTLMASTLQELLDKGIKKLGFGDDEDVRAVIEYDGFEVDEEDYFQSLKDNTIFILLRPEESWRPASDPCVCVDKLL